MKHLFTLFSAVLLSSFSFGQVFQSELSSWSAGDPTDWMGTTTNIGSANVVEQTALPQFGTSWASLMNTSPTSHKRFTTQSVSVTEGETYTITMYVYGTQAEYRTNFYDLTNGEYGNYNEYLSLATTGGALQTTQQNVTIPYGSSCTSAEFILSVRNTQDLLGIGMGVDKIDISVAGITHTPKTIYEIQYTTSPSGDSPEMGNYVETSGVVTATYPGKGYWIQDGSGAFTGVFVADIYNTPSIDDSVTIKGQVVEFFEKTQIENIGLYTLESSPSVIPTATVVTTPQIQTEEEWEGVLIQAANVECTSNNEGFGMWEINSNPGTQADSALVDDDLFSFTASVGNTYDVTGIGDFSFGDRKILPRDLNDINGAGSGITAIYDIQYDNTSGASNYDGLTVTTAGIVTGIFQIGDQYTFFIQDGNGAWNGIYVFEDGTSAQALVIGDSVFVTGEVDEFNSLTEIKFVSDITVQNSGNTLPTPSIVTNATAGDEEWEGVLVTLEGGIAGAANTFNEWEINDGTSSNIVKVDDNLLSAPFTPVVGNGYDVTGIRHFSFSENFILPTDVADIVLVGTAGIDDIENNFTIYPNPAYDNVVVTGEANTRVKIYSATGAIVAIGFTNQEIPVSGLQAGVYQIVYNEKGNKTTKKLMIK
jgi:hypothetical protein